MNIPKWAEKALERPAKFTSDEINEARDVLALKMQETAQVELVRKTITLKGRKHGKRG